MAQLVKLSVLSICLALLQTGVLSHPTSGATTTATATPAAAASAGAGATTAAQASGAAGLATEVSSAGVIPGQNLASVAAETAGNLSKDGAVVINGLADGVADAIEDTAKFGAALAGSGGEMIQIGADKLGGFARLPPQLVFGEIMGGEGGAGGGLLPGFATNGGSAGGFSFGGSGIGGSLNGLARWPQGALQSLSALRPEQIQALARAGMLGAVNVGDNASGRFNTDVVQPWVRGAGDTFDGGLSILGIQQPYGRQVADAAWQMGENRRQDMVQGARDFASGNFRFPILYGQELSLGSNGGGSTGISLGGLPTSSLQATVV